MARPIPFVLVLALAVAGCSTPTEPDAVRSPESPAGPAAPSPVVSAIVDLTNAERSRAGLAMLRSDSRLMQAAEIQARQVAEHDRLEHTIAGAQYPTLQDRIAAVGYRWQSIGDVVTQLKWIAEHPFPVVAPAEARR